jgi:hypothetical protein
VLGANVRTAASHSSKTGSTRKLWRQITRTLEGRHLFKMLAGYPASFHRDIDPGRTFTRPWISPSVAIRVRLSRKDLTSIFYLDKNKTSPQMIQ